MSDWRNTTELAAALSHWRNRRNTTELIDICTTDDYSEDEDDDERERDFVTFWDETKWAEIRQWLNSNKDNTKFFQDNATFDYPYQGDTNWTALHIMLSKRPPLDVIETYVKHSPETLEYASHDSMLPIHVAAAYLASPEVIQILADACPESLQEGEAFNRLPLCLACEAIDVDEEKKRKRKPSLEMLQVLDILIKAYPEAIDVDDEAPTLFLSRDSFHLHDACRGDFSVHLVDFLLAFSPECCTLRDSDGKIPLHYACANKSEDQLNIIRTLSNENPTHFTTVADNQGKTPSQLFKETASAPDENGMLLLHRLAASPNGLHTSDMELLIITYPEAMSLPDNHGMLPFHHACLNAASSIDVLMVLIKLYPEVLMSNQKTETTSQTKKRRKKE